ncbi:MAG: sulfatase-like hydrolase/transferase [Planctomycetota bacterium]
MASTLTNGSALGQSLEAATSEGAATAQAPGPSDGRVSPDEQRDNILLVIADDLGVDQVAAYGLGVNPAPTPTISSLADAGVLFENAWANPLCSPSRASLMTGRHAFRHRVGAPVPPQSGAETPGLALPEVTIAEVLKTGGYATGFFGKWHISNTVTGGADAPNLQGFDHFAGSLGGSLFSYTDWTKVINGEIFDVFEYATTDTVNDAIDWVTDQSGPWFMVVSFNAPHDPFHAPPQNLHSYDLRGEDPRLNPRPFYKAMVESVDTEFGRLLDAIPGWEANTTVIFIGDNGTPRGISEAPFDPARSKGTPYEGGVQVPLIIAGAGVRERGEADGLVQVLDLFATIAELADADLDDVLPDDLSIDSKSLERYLDWPNRRSQRDVIYTELFADGNPARGEAAIRDDRYKLMLVGGRLRFYDLQRDPFELEDLLPLSRLTPPQRRAYDDLFEEAIDLRGSE